MKKRILSFLRIFVSAGLILILLYIMRNNYLKILNILKGTRIPVLFLGFAVFLCAVAIASIRLMLIIRAQDIPVTFTEAFSLTFIGYFFNNFLPTAIGGDVVKAYYLGKKSQDTMGSFTAVFVDRAVGLFTMIFMAFLALMLARNMVIDNRIRYVIYAITAGALVVMLFMVSRKFAGLFSAFLFLLRPIEDKLRRAYNTVNKYRHHKMLMIQSFSISIVSQIFFFFSLGIVALSVGSPIPVVEIFLKLPIISTMSLLPSINGLGLREGATIVFFGPLIGKNSAFAVSLLWLLVLFVISLIGGIIYALSPQFKIKIKERELSL